MPVRRVLVVSAEVEVAEIERTERVVSVVPSGDGALLVFTEPKSVRVPVGDKETRNT